MIKSDSRRYEPNCPSSQPSLMVLERIRNRNFLWPGYWYDQDQYSCTLFSDLPRPEIQPHALGRRSFCINILYSHGNHDKFSMSANQESLGSYRQSEVYRHQQDLYRHGQYERVDGFYTAMPTAAAIVETSAVSRNKTTTDWHI